MKKTLLLSVVASGLLFAGGDIAPVEPAVVTPAPAPAPVVDSGWKFSGQAVVYYQTDDSYITSRGVTSPQDDSLFSQGASAANAGLQLTATNDDLIAGIGFGAQINGLGTLGLDEDVVSDVMQTAGSELNSAYISQLYLTYGINNTSFKVGRQELPKALSPFAYSEDWNVFKNTYNAALVVNTDIPDTVLVGAWVRDANWNGLHADMSDFGKLNGNDGVWMLTAQNKSIADLTLTGSFYYANDFANILWVDAQYNAGVANIGLQGGAIMPDASAADDTTAFGAKVSGKFDIVNASIAYTTVNDGSTPILNFGGSSSVLYTNTVSNEMFPMITTWDADKVLVKADADVLGGNLGLAYGHTDSSAIDNIDEIELTYKTKLVDAIDLEATYAYVDADAFADEINGFRLVGRYNF
ncbi:conserved exported hypothetical protein [Sulfurovum sp. enrichment culture clone C5]|uniref:Porin n=1 Tax=Sulfurovum sp. enrichment culture clone C5 TaxID=497650 RepID=A0A0S4XQK7_9BACT|nr:conserved exported hypothetical protein [Sulfurovum sp. enrichment culture clone C5]